jgi:hypothetical protein
MDVAISSNGEATLCLLCKDADCEVYVGYGIGYDCQREDAYGVLEEC